MIHFERHEKDVRLTVDAEDATGAARGMWFYWDAGTEVAAGALAKVLHENLHDRLETIMRKSYEQGWRDAKAKKPKRDYFRFGWWIHWVKS